MAEISVSFKGIERVRFEFEELSRMVEPRLRKGLVKAGAMLAIHMKSLHGRRPYPLRRTQTLWQSIDFQYRQDFIVRVGPGGLAGKYAPVLEEGATIRQVVTPKQQRYLAAAKQIYVRAGSTLTIKIPPYPYVSPTWDQKGEAAIQTIISEVLQ